jgi:hypothetical protein
VIGVQNALITPTRCCFDGILDAVRDSLLVVFNDAKDSASRTVTNGGLEAHRNPTPFPSQGTCALCLGFRHMPSIKHPIIQPFVSNLCFPHDLSSLPLSSLYASTAFAMSDSDENPAIPSWQRNTAPDDTDAVASSETATIATADDQLDVARRFLQDDAVKNEPREKKAGFLREKGIDEEDVQKLLAELPAAQSSSEVEVLNPLS